MWRDPLALDPARISAKVTREVSNELAQLATSLEAAKHAPQAVAAFLTRCLFSMFAEDVGPVRLLFAIPHHPWVDNAQGAVVRIAMTVGKAAQVSVASFALFAKADDLTTRWISTSRSERAQ